MRRLVAAGVINFGAQRSAIFVEQDGHVAEEYIDGNVKKGFNHVAFARHDCGLCDGPLTYNGRLGGYDQWLCKNPKCDWHHTSQDCCEGGATVTKPQQRSTT